MEYCYCEQNFKTVWNFVVQTEHISQSYPILGNESLHCVDQSKLNLLFHTQLVKKSQFHEKCSTIMYIVQQSFTNFKCSFSMSINYEMQAVNFVILFMWVCQKWGINLGMHNFYKYVVFIIALSRCFLQLRYLVVKTRRYLQN